MERVEQKDQKVGKYKNGSEPVSGALIEVHRALGPGLVESAYEACFWTTIRSSTPLSAAPSTFLSFPIFLSAFSSLCALAPFHSVDSRY
jgi:hypothetical protein